MATDSPIIVALDFDRLEPVTALVERLDPSLCRLKVGKELFTRFGPIVVDMLHTRGYEVFLDLKFHDIPNTVAAAIRAAADLGVWMVNVHASGGVRMMEAAADAIRNVSNPPILIAVTVLTSMTGEDLRAVGLDVEPAEQVERLARLAASSGLSGVVCSAQESSRLRQIMPDHFVLVTPGIRPAGTDTGDQRRVAAPAQALADGSNYLVIGRPITQHERPEEMLVKIHQSLPEA